MPEPKVASAEGRVAVAGTTGPLAVEAGLHAMRNGGSAVDGALTTAVAQIALAAGAWVSYAGMLTLTYCEAATGEAFSLDAGWNTVAGEDDPLSIPPWPSSNGRSVPVPGFMAGVRAAHERFGSLPWASLFEPAIHIADEGFAADEMFARFVRERGPFSPFSAHEGDVVRQPEVAELLRAVASDGAAHMYTGAWAEQFVDAVRAAGGKVTLDDLAGYEPMWTAPIQSSYRDYQIVAPGFPSYGAVYPVEAMNLLELADLRAPEWEDPESLYWHIQVTRQGHALNRTLEDGRVDFEAIPLADRLTKEHARSLWDAMRAAKRTVTVDEFLAGAHSDGVVTADADGNLCAITHSINTLPWGHTGVRVQGVALPDPFGLYQGLIAQTGPGKRLPQGMHPLVVTRDGRPVLASSTIGAAGHESTTGYLMSVLDHGLTPAGAIDRPVPLLPAVGVLPGLPFEPDKQLIAAGDFSDEVLDGVRQRGQDLIVVDSEDGRLARGFWVGIKVEPDGTKRAGAGPYLRGGAAAL